MSNEIRQESRQIAFYEGEFLVKALESEEELRPGLPSSTSSLRREAQMGAGDE